MAQTTKLTDAQLQANKNAIHLFIAQATAKYGRGSVILLPEFIEQGDGTWIPKADSTGRRATDSGSAFLRLGKQYLISNGKTNKVSYMFTNEFADSDEDLHSFLLYVDPNAVVGGAVRGCRLVIHESLKPFSKVNPERDIKWANREQGLKCTKYVVDLDTAEMKQMPIYRRTKAFFADDNGEFPFFKPENDSFEEVQKCAMKTAKDFFILHDNEEELSDAAVARVLADRKTKDDNAAIEKAKQNRLAELQGKATLSAAETQELKTLAPKPVAETPTVPTTGETDKVPF